MNRRTQVIFGALFLAISSSTLAGTLFLTDALIEADVNEQIHPDGLSTGVFVPIDLEKAQICLHYTNSIKKSDQGKIRADVTIIRDDAESATLKLNGRVRKNEMLLCKKAPPLMAGDAVLFEMRFLNMPRLRIRGNRSERAGIKGIVKAGVKYPEPELEPEPEPEPTSCPPASDPTPNSDPNPAPPPSSPPPPPPPPPDPAPDPQGGLSSADFVAAAKLLKANAPVQLWRAKSSWGRGKWWVIGPRTVIDTSQTGNVNPTTVGFGNTISEAVKNYEKKRGNLTEGGSLSSAERDLLVWYSGIDSSGGPTSVRRSGSGGYYGEFYRPGRGATHDGPFGSLEAALRWLKKQGL